MIPEAAHGSPVMTGSRRLLAAVALVLSLLPASQARAQGLTVSLLDRYIDSLRQQSGIPGLAATLVQDGTVVWERGYGMADVARSIEVRPDTPFPIGGLTQALSAAILLEQCVETGHLDLDDKVQQ